MRFIPYMFALGLASQSFAMTPDEIETAVYDGSALPDGQSPIVVRLQVLLDRAGISPGVIDGYNGGMSESALRAFEARENLSVDGLLDSEVWSLLGGDKGDPVLMTYTIVQVDAEDLSEAIPENVAEKAKMSALNYTSVSEKLAERFHMDEDFLKALNPNVSFGVGETVTVTDPGSQYEGTAARVEIRKSERRAVVFDDNGAILSSYPVAIGSEQTPSPSGAVTVTAVAMDPTYSYRPDVNFVADGVEEALTLPPGPNGPVGSVWIDLSKPTYGLHGTDTPASLFTARSHGCVRFANWDVEELAYMVSQGVSVEFVE